MICFVCVKKMFDRIFIFCVIQKSYVEEHLTTKCSNFILLKIRQYASSMQIEMKDTKTTKHFSKKSNKS